MASFRYENFKIVSANGTECTVEGDVYNDSDIDAKEVVQLYVRDVSSFLSKPSKELRGFEKVLVKSHGKTRVRFTLTEKDFACFSTADDAWIVEEGWYEIQIGASSRDIKFVLPLKIGEAPVYY